MVNLVLHITLPEGLRLMDGRVLKQQTTVSVISNLDPFLCSVKQVQLAGGLYLDRLAPFTIACQIYESSKFAETITHQFPAPPPDGQAPSHQYTAFHTARQRFVIAHAAATAIKNVWDMAGARSNRTLANFSVGQQAIVTDEGLPKLLTGLLEEANGWKIVLKSGGRVAFEGHVPGSWGARMDSDAPAGRTWFNSGSMGANRKTVPGFGSAGKPAKYGTVIPSFAMMTGVRTPYMSGFSPVLTWRMQAFQGAYVAQFNNSLVF